MGYIALEFRAIANVIAPFIKFKIVILLNTNFLYCYLIVKLYIILLLWYKRDT